MKRLDILTLIFFIISTVLLLGILFFMTHESSKCLANPSKVFYTALKGSNPEALIDCSCSLINKESYLLLGINETGVFVKQRSFP